MDVEHYIQQSDVRAQPALRTIREMVRAHCPDAEEVMSYKMPAFRQGKVFIYYAAFQKHIGIYPPVVAPADLLSDLQPFRGPKGNLQFPYSRDMPYALIGRVIDALHAAYAVRK